jgi:pimeloyl-ACP methyl ester carboxylesterase
MPVMAMLEVPGAVLAYDVVGEGPVLLLVGQPMDSRGFATLASYFGDRTVVTYDPRGLWRSTREDGRAEQDPRVQAGDLHALIGAIGGGPVDVFASSGGAVSALALVAAHPRDVRLLVAHEPPTIPVLPDADRAFAAERAVQAAYAARGFGAGMAGFIALTSWSGELPEVLELPEPAAFGLPAEDDGAREDPLLSGAGNAVTAYEPDFAALRAAPTRIVVGVGVRTGDTLTGRTSAGVAAALGLPLTGFPGGHGGFLGGEFGQTGEPEAFAARLREVLAG